MQLIIKKFKAKNIYMFNDIDIDLEQKNIIVGCNGTGKTTLLDIFNGLLCLLVDSSDIEVIDFFNQAIENRRDNESFCELELHIKDNNVIVDYLMITILTETIINMLGTQRWLQITEETVESIRKIIMDNIGILKLKYDVLLEKFTVNDKNLWEVIKNIKVQIIEKVNQNINIVEDINNENFAIISKYLVKLKEIIDHKDYIQMISQNNIVSFSNIYLNTELSVSHTNINNRDINRGISDILLNQFSYIQCEYDVNVHDFEEYHQKKLSLVIKSHEHNKKIRKLAGKVCPYIEIKNTLMYILMYDKCLFKDINNYYHSITDKYFTVSYIDEYCLDAEYYNQR